MKVSALQEINNEFFLIKSSQASCHAKWLKETNVSETISVPNNQRTNMTGYIPIYHCPEPVLMAGQSQALSMFHIAFSLLFHWTV